MKNLCYDRLDDTPIDHLWVAMADCGVVAVTFRGDEESFVTYLRDLTGLEPQRDPAGVQTLAVQLRQYLSGWRQNFELPICWDVMTPFQQKVLRLVHFIPYGELRTYRDIAEVLGNLKTIRAVGQANANNPMPLIIPCHRVVGVDGSLRGFGGGLETKAWLLRMEGSWLL